MVSNCVPQVWPKKLKVNYYNRGTMIGVSAVSGLQHSYAHPLPPPKLPSSHTTGVTFSRQQRKWGQQLWGRVAPNLCKPLQTSTIISELLNFCLNGENDLSSYNWDVDATFWLQKAPGTITMRHGMKTAHLEHLNASVSRLLTEKCERQSRVSAGWLRLPLTAQVCVISPQNSFNSL